MSWAVPSYPRKERTPLSLSLLARLFPAGEGEEATPARRSRSRRAGCVSSLCRATRLERNVRPRSFSLTVESVFLRLIRLNTATHRLELTLHARQLPHCRFYYPVRLPLSGYDSLVYDLTKEKKKKCNSPLVSTVENPWMNYPTFPLPRVENRNRVEFISAKIYLLGLYIFGRKGNCRYEDRTKCRGQVRVYSARLCLVSCSIAYTSGSVMYRVCPGLPRLGR